MHDKDVTKIIFLSMLLAFIVNTSCFAGSKLFQLGHLYISAGSFIHPLSYLIVSLVTIGYGINFAKKIILFSSLFNLGSALFLVIMSHVSGAEIFNVQNNNYDQVMGVTGSILIFSSIAYYCSEMLNAKLLNYFSSRLFSSNSFLIALLSTSAAIILDTLFMIPVMAKSAQYNFYIILYKVLSLIIIKICFEALILTLLPSCLNFIRKDDVLLNSSQRISSIKYQELLND